MDELVVVEEGGRPIDLLRLMFGKFVPDVDIERPREPRRIVGTTLSVSIAGTCAC